jgi:hypothetical protein
MVERDLTFLPTFVSGMIGKCEENYHKGAWVYDSLTELFWALEDEVQKELKLDLDEYTMAERGGFDKEMREQLMRAIDECFDVANYAFFVADKCRTLLEEMDGAPGA